MQAPLQARNDSDAAQMDAARAVAQKRVLADSRPEALAQRKLAEMMNNSPCVLQQRALSDAIHNSPRMVAQRHEMNALFGGTVKTQEAGAMLAEASPAQREEKTNNTGLPNRLKSGIESLSGMSMDHVAVHYNSDKPAQLQAHAYAQGNEIHLGAGQERHLPHEAWHVVQQAQGRVRPTFQMKAGAVNDDPSLEKEADMMGERAAQFEGDHVARNLVAEERVAGAVTQRVAGFAERTNASAAGANLRTQLQDNGFVDNRASTLVQYQLHSSSRLIAQRAMSEHINHGHCADAFGVPSGKNVAQREQEAQEGALAQQAEQRGKLTDNEHAGMENVELATAKAPAAVGAVASAEGAPPSDAGTTPTPKQAVSGQGAPGIEEYLAISLRKHEDALRQLVYPPGHPGLHGQLPEIAPPPVQKMSARIAGSGAPGANAGAQAPIQRVQATRNGTFDNAAPKAATGAGLPPMGAIAGGGVTANNTGISGARTGINNPAYGSGVGGTRPTNWVPFCNLTGYTGANWYQLHLMNDNLGGQGIGSNLAPGSPSFNGQHRAGAETPVKNWAGYAGNNTAASQAADYTVQAVYGNPAAVHNDTITKYTNTFNFPARINGGVNFMRPLVQADYVNFLQQHYLNATYPGLLNQYQLDLQAHQAAVQHNQVAGPLGQPLVAVPPLPVAPVLPAAYVQVLGPADLLLINQVALNQVTQILNAQMATDRTWLLNYVANTFPSRFTCTAVFYGENPPGTVVASAAQTIDVGY